jgi:putative transposase
MQRVKRKSSGILLRGYSFLIKPFWGRNFWAKGFFVASSGKATDEVIKEYIRTLEITKDDDEFKVDEG